MYGTVGTLVSIDENNYPTFFNLKFYFTWGISLGEHLVLMLLVTW